jgi:hypothetical protein
MKSSNGIQPPAAASRDAIRSTSADDGVDPAPTAAGVSGVAGEPVWAPGVPGLELRCIENEL